ncbi:protein of unknown function DUF1653 [Bacillus phage Hyb1phi3Ts-SPbeta]|nr:hypothetical protein phi3T_161 [Bacillus phage phi3T]QNN96745.1 hypothetical protein [Bacillus phage phi3Ts]QNR51650.1 protein of unknown function DUF1653 [Bacillus phage Hyb1phi3Ts-SPbeta]
MRVYDVLLNQAIGRIKEYKHKKGKENKQTTKLQNFLSETSLSHIKKVLK